jgi:catechol-2,3-dioxygenase
LVLNTIRETKDFHLYFIFKDKSSLFTINNLHKRLQKRVLSETVKQAHTASTGGYHYHIAINTWHSKGAATTSVYAAGFYHTAILYPEKKDLADILKSLQAVSYPLSGALIMVCRWPFI